MMGVVDIFTADDDDENDPLSLKKLQKLEAMWALHKDILGFSFNGVENSLAWSTKMWFFTHYPSGVDQGE